MDKSGKRRSRKRKYQQMDANRKVRRFEGLNDDQLELVRISYPQLNDEHLAVLRGAGEWDDIKDWFNKVGDELGKIFDPQRNGLAKLVNDEIKKIGPVFDSLGTQLANELDPEKNGVNAALRKFGNDTAASFNELGRLIEEQAKKDKAALEAAFKPVGEFMKNLGDAQWWKDTMNNPETYFLLASIMISAAASFLGPGGVLLANGVVSAARLITKAARGEQVNISDAVEVVVGLIPGGGGAKAATATVKATQTKFITKVAGELKKAPKDPYARRRMIGQSLLTLTKGLETLEILPPLKRAEQRSPVKETAEVIQFNKEKAVWAGYNKSSNNWWYFATPYCRDIGMLKEIVITLYEPVTEDVPYWSTGDPNPRVMHKYVVVKPENPGPPPAAGAYVPVRTMEGPKLSIQKLKYPLKFQKDDVVYKYPLFKYTDVMAEEPDRKPKFYKVLKNVDPNDVPLTDTATWKVLTQAEAEDTPAPDPYTDTADQYIGNVDTYEQKLDVWNELPSLPKQPYPNEFKVIEEFNTAWAKWKIEYDAYMAYIKPPKIVDSNGYNKKDTYLFGAEDPCNPWPNWPEADYKYRAAPTEEYMLDLIKPFRAFYEKQKQIVIDELQTSQEIRYYDLKKNPDQKEKLLKAGMDRLLEGLKSGTLQLKKPDGSGFGGMTQRELWRFRNTTPFEGFGLPQLTKKPDRVDSNNILAWTRTNLGRTITSFYNAFLLYPDLQEKIHEVIQEGKEKIIEIGQYRSYGEEMRTTRDLIQDDIYKAVDQLNGGEIKPEEFIGLLQMYEGALAESQSPPDLAKDFDPAGQIRALFNEYPLSLPSGGEVYSQFMTTVDSAFQITDTLDSILNKVNPSKEEEVLEKYRNTQNIWSYIQDPFKEYVINELVNRYLQVPQNPYQNPTPKPDPYPAPKPNPDNLNHLAGSIITLYETAIKNLLDAFSKYNEAVSKISITKYSERKSNRTKLGDALFGPLPSTTIQKGTGSASGVTTAMVTLPRKNPDGSYVSMDQMQQDAKKLIYSFFMEPNPLELPIPDYKNGGTENVTRDRLVDVGIPLGPLYLDNWRKFVEYLKQEWTYDYKGEIEIVKPEVIASSSGAYLEWAAYLRNELSKFSIVDLVEESGTDMFPYLQNIGFALFNLIRISKQAEKLDDTVMDSNQVNITAFKSFIESRQKLIFTELNHEPAYSWNTPTTRIPYKLGEHESRKLVSFADLKEAAEKQTLERLKVEAERVKNKQSLDDDMVRRKWQLKTFKKAIDDGKSPDEAYTMITADYPGAEFIRKEELEKRKSQAERDRIKANFDMGLDPDGNVLGLAEYLQAQEDQKKWEEETVKAQRDAAKAQEDAETAAVIALAESRKFKPATEEEIKAYNEKVYSPEAQAKAQETSRLQNEQMEKIGTPDGLEAYLREMVPKYKDAYKTKTFEELAEINERYFILALPDWLDKALEKKNLLDMNKTETPFSPSTEVTQAEVAMPAVFNPIPNETPQAALERYQGQIAQNDAMIATSAQQQAQQEIAASMEIADMENEDLFVGDVEPPVPAFAVQEQTDEETLLANYLTQIALMEQEQDFDQNVIDQYEALLSLRGDGYRYKKIKSGRKSRYHR